MGAALYRARADLRRRWRAVAALTLLAGLAGGAVLTTVAGARRSASAYERFRHETLAGDLDIAPSDPQPEQFDEIGRLPQVEALTRPVFPFIRPRGSDLYPFLEFLVLGATDTKFGTVIDRPRMIRGRMPRADRADEVAVIGKFADEADLEVGDRVEFESYAPSQFESLFGSGDAGPPAGPVVTLTVTGIVHAPDFLSEGQATFQPRAVVSPAFSRQYEESVGIYPGGARVRLQRGARDVPAVAEAARRIFQGDPELELQTASETTEKIDDSLRVLVVALLLCAGAAGVAGTVTLGQALARHLGQASSEQHALAAVGMDRRQRISTMAAATLPVVVGGAVVAVGVAVLASPLMPVGVARLAEPDRGISFDGAVLGLGFLATVVVLAALSLGAAWATTRSSGVAPGATGTGGARPPALLRMLSPALPTAAGTTGVRMAFERRSSRGAVPIRAALAGIAFAVAGVVAVVVFASSLTALVDRPARYGHPWDAVVAGFGGGVIEEHGEDLVADPTIAALGVMQTSIARIGGDDVNVVAFESLKGDAAPTVLAGRFPVRPGEVVLGTDTMRDAGVDLGETVEMTGGGGAVKARVVGRGAFPVVDERSAVAKGAMVTRASLEDLVTPESINNDVVVTWREGVDEAGANRRLGERTETEVFAPRVPAAVDNLRRVEALPEALAAFLAILGTVALAHALVSTVRRRRQDFAVLRTLGFVRRQVSVALVWQASTFAAVGLLVGVPLGVAVGRMAWTFVSTEVGVVNRPTVPLLTLLLIGLAVFVGANLVAAVPARIARRIRPATVLRTG